MIVKRGSAEMNDVCGRVEKGETEKGETSGI